MKQFLDVFVDRTTEGDILGPDFLSFSIEGWKFPHSRFSGKVVQDSVTRLADTLSFSMEIETGSEVIPLSALGQGTSIKLFAGTDNNSVVIGEVRRRVLHPATSESWKHSPMPEASRVRLEYARTFTQHEYERLKLGNTPSSVIEPLFVMFVYFDDPWLWLYIHITWAGVCMFQVRIEQIQDGFRVSEAWTSYPRIYGKVAAWHLDEALNMLCREAVLFD